MGWREALNELDDAYQAASGNRKHAAQKKLTHLKLQALR